MSLNTYILNGKAYFAKVLGTAPPGYNDGPPEWSVEVVPDEAGLKRLNEQGATFYIRDKANGPTVQFRRKAIKRDGEPAKPIEVVDHNNKPWDHSKLIGNGSTVNICYTLNEVKDGKGKRLKPSILSLQVWDYIPYTPKSPFAAKAEDDVTSTKEW